MITNLYLFLNANVAINSIHNVHTFNLAAGDSDTFMESKDVDYSKESNWGAASLFHMQLNSNNEEYTKYSNDKVNILEIVKLDTLFSSKKWFSKFQCPKIIKTDAESADYMVLKGGKNHLKIIIIIIV